MSAAGMSVSGTVACVVIFVVVTVAVLALWDIYDQNPRRPK